MTSAENQILNSIEKIFEKNNTLITQGASIALWALLRALDLNQKKIIVPSNICFVVPRAILSSGNIPYFIDIDEKNNFDIHALENINDPDIAAIIVPYMYGNLCDINSILAIAKNKKWLVIEDMAQALGAKIGQRYAGSFADYTIASFGIGKSLDSNFGGVLSTKDKYVLERAKKIYDSLPFEPSFSPVDPAMIKMYLDALENFKQKIDVSREGQNIARTFEQNFLKKTILSTEHLEQIAKKLNNLDEIITVSTDNARNFQKHLSDCEHINVVVHEDGSVYWRQNILVPHNRNSLLQHLRDNKIKASTYFPSIDYLFAARKSAKEYSRSDLFAEQVINLWTGHQTTAVDILQISKVIKGHKYS